MAAIAATAAAAALQVNVCLHSQFAFLKLHLHINCVQLQWFITVLHLLHMYKVIQPELLGRFFDLLQRKSSWNALFSIKFLLFSDFVYIVEWFQFVRDKSYFSKICHPVETLWCQWTISGFSVQDKITTHFALLYCFTVWLNEQTSAFCVCNMHTKSTDICAVLNHFRHLHFRKLSSPFFGFSFRTIFTHQTTNIWYLLLTFEPILMRAIGVKP